MTFNPAEIEPCGRQCDSHHVIDDGDWRGVDIDNYAMVTTSTVTALSLLSMDPSPAVVRSARDAAESRHGLVNLTRLVHSLDRHSEEQGGLTWLEVQKTWEVGARVVGGVVLITQDFAVRSSSPVRVARCK